MDISDHSIIRLSNQHQSIWSYIDGLPTETLYKRYEKEIPSIHEVIAYLSRYQYVWLERIKDICETINPYFSIYDSKTDPEFSFIIAKTTGCLVREMCLFRDQIISFIKSLPRSFGSRIGTHAVFGRMTLNEWLEFFLLHESRELFRIFKVACAIRSTEFGAASVIPIPWLQLKSG